MIDYHIHLERGSYQMAWLQEFIDQGHARGIDEFGIVEHLYLFKESSEIIWQNEHVRETQNKNLADYFSFINQAKRRHPLKLGLEVDYLTTKEEQIREVVKDLPVDFLIGSVHYLGEWAFDLDSDWQGRNIETVYEQYYSTLLKVAQSGIFDILGHCGNIAYYGYVAQNYPQLAQAFWHNLAKTDIVVEINTGGLYRPAGVVFPELHWLPLLYELGIQVTLSSDAHDPQHTGWQIIDQAVPALKAAGYRKIATFENRERIMIPI